MNKIDTLLSIYDCLYSRRGVSPLLFTPFRRIVRFFAKRCIPQLLGNETYDHNKKQSDIIVSLTSFPTRITNVHLVIRCLLRQTVLPEKIILWLSKDQFEGIELPSSLVNMKNEIFDISFVDGDIRSHKKYAYVLKEFPKSRILIVDDDIYYPSNMLEKILLMSDKYPDDVICRYGSIVSFNKENPNTFHSWWWEVAENSDNQNFFFGSGGGVILRKDMLYQDVLNIELAQRLTPIADDIWLNAMVNLKGTKKHKIKCGLILQIEEQQGVRLTSENTGNNMNDVQFDNIIDYYKSTIGINPFAQRF